MLQPRQAPSEMAQAIAHGPPYPPTVAGVGGIPTVAVDVPILAVLIALYLTSAIINMTLFQRNRRRGHKFVPSALMFGFSMARIVTCSLRIGWATAPHNVSLSIAAGIFVQAGILIIYIINLLFAQRILRARCSEVGWHRAERIFFRVLYVLVFVALVLLITLTVMSFYTLDPSTRSDALWIQRGSILFLMTIAALPLFVVPLAFILPQSPNPQTFGRGSLRSKAIILTICACICTTIAGFKVGTNWSTPRPLDRPAWFDSKPAFYMFVFVPEILILCLYIGTRVDQRFHVPDGSSKRKSYDDGGDAEKKAAADVTERRDSGVAGSTV